jgi:hypothetical protein
LIVAIKSEERDEMSGEIETPATQPAGETPATATSAETTPAVETTQAAPEFEALLATLPADVQAAYKAHVAGLTSALDKERKANKKRDEAEARKLQEAEAAKLSDVEKAKKQADALKAERDELAQQLRAINARETLIIAAEKLKIEFASAQAQRDALGIALQSAEYDDEGALVGAEALLKAALKDRDYLIKKAAAPVGDTSATKRGAMTADITDVERQKELARRFRVSLPRSN